MGVAGGAVCLDPSARQSRSQLPSGGGQTDGRTDGRTGGTQIRNRTSETKALSNHTLQMGEEGHTDKKSRTQKLQMHVSAESNEINSQCRFLWIVNCRGIVLMSFTATETHY